MYDEKQSTFSKPSFNIMYHKENLIHIQIEDYHLFQFSFLIYYCQSPFLLFKLTNKTLEFKEEISLVINKIGDTSQYNCFFFFLTFKIFFL